jgi:DNA polymerase-3 subunit delta'
MLVGDVEEPVIAAATRTPFEAARRVFVIEGVDQMNDQAANRMLKTLEEPPAFVHLLLLTDRPEDVLATISSRCQQVRFDPLPPQGVADRLIERGVEPGRALACARLAMGDARLASWLASPEGDELREAAREFVTAALEGRSAEGRWMALLDGARAAGERAGEIAQEELGSSLEMLPSKERKRAEREGVTDRRRVERRERTRTLDRGLTLAELWLRDLLCMHEGARELIHAVDRLPELEGQAGQARESIARYALPRALDLLSDTRLTLAQNVSEELALEALSHRLTALSGTLAAR